jgi:hypothetical protein
MRVLCAMTQLQVILKGESWTKRILVTTLSVAIILIILEALRPGTTASVLAAIKNGALWIYDFTGDVWESLKKLLGIIRNWY